MVTVPKGRSMLAMMESKRGDNSGMFEVRV